jgi:hypothetical protein
MMSSDVRANSNFVIDAPNNTTSGDGYMSAVPSEGLREQRAERREQRAETLEQRAENAGRRHTLATYSP